MNAWSRLAGAPGPRRPGAGRIRLAVTEPSLVESVPGEQRVADASSVGAIVRRLGPAAALGIVAAIMPAIGGFVIVYYADTVGGWLRGHEASGLALYVAAFALLAGLALLPTYAQSFLGGWAFEFAWAFPAALGGFLGGSWIGYEVARGASGDRVERLIEEKPRWLAVRNALVGRGFWPTLGIIALLRMPPNSPFAVTNLVLASVKVRRAPFLLGTLIGMAPRTAAAVGIGALAAGMAARDALRRKPEWWMFAIAVGAVLVVIAVIGAIAKRAIDRVTRPASADRPVA